MAHHLAAEDRKFLADFEMGRIAPADFDHRAHLRLAYVLLAGSDTGQASARMRQTLLRFLDHHGIDPGKFHLTLTEAWIKAVRHFMAKTPASTSADDFIDQHPQMLDSRIMLSHYSAARLFSDEARATFVEPDLDPITISPAREVEGMQVIFIHGPAAAGKYTIGKLLSERTGLPLFHNHLAVDPVKTLFEFGTPPFVGLRAEIWRQCFRAAAEAGRSFIFTFHPEASVDPDLVGELVEIVESRGGRVQFVELYCPEDVVLERINNDSRHAFGKLTDPDLYRALAAQGAFEFPSLPAALVIDTGTVDAATAAAMIEERLLRR